eukprot:CAMPEP_0173242618 /NCGR_PEP_ID=MMETSP1142-20121109/15044_1 /TAXON_ID=483371 /ORGANISM="non described non described, Strain CCMP2298" /LENGTH=94 /DNA_ID=CAMNT_0014174115 /DNA_START=349 /DNA_END=632 /DNA_ORIENTATION=+
MPPSDLVSKFENMDSWTGRDSSTYFSEAARNRGDPALACDWLSTCTSGSTSTSHGALQYVTVEELIDPVTKALAYHDRTCYICGASAVEIVFVR